MNAAVFAEWMRRQGYRVVQTASSYWYNPAPGVFQAFPYHWVIAPSDDEIRDLMLRNGAVAVRYSTPLDFGRGLASYHITLKEPYSLEHLKAQARNGVRAGLAHFKIEQVSFERLAGEGWLLQRDTLERQDRLRSMSQENWEKLCRSASDLPGFEAWAATEDGELAAAVIVARMDSIFSVPFAMSHRKFLGQHVNNALFFAVSKELLGREGIESLFFTVQSLDAHPNVDEFKFRMGLRANLVRQCVDFNPLASPFASPMVHGWARRLLQGDPSNPVFAKTEGMLRFHLEGQRPIEEQDWPERLLPERDRLVPKPMPLLKTRHIEVGPATAFDVNTLVDLHGACFSKHEHIPVQLGRSFILAVYRWFVSCPNNTVLVARREGRIVGFTTLSDRPYNLPMLLACRREMVRGYLRHPSAIFNLELFRRLGRILVRSNGQPREKVAHIAFTGVDPSFQGQGIGKALKEASIQLCRERGMVAMATGVRRRNDRAIHLNQHAGFVEVPSLSTRRLIYLRLNLLA
jgi:GNAT superfamily N-acetyltransferase